MSTTNNNGEKFESFSFEIQNKTGMLTLTTCINTGLDILVRAGTEEIIKDMYLGKDAVILSQIFEDIILYRSNPRDDSKRSLGLIHTCSKTKRYKSTGKVNSFNLH